MAEPPVLPEAVWRDFNVPGVPQSGPYKPLKNDIIALLRWMTDALDALGAATGTDLTVITKLRADLTALSGRVDAIVAGAPEDLNSFAEVAARLNQVGAVSLAELSARGLRIGPDVPPSLGPFTIAGKTGRVVAGLMAGLTWFAVRLRAERSLHVGDSRFESNPSANSGWSWALTGKSGKPVLGFLDRDLYLHHAGRSADLKMLARDPGNVARAQGARSPSNARHTRLPWEYNLLLIDGQSLSTANEGWPRLSKVARADCFMVGNSVRPAGEGTTWTPVGGSTTLQPMVATIETESGTPISDADAANLPPGDNARGENVIVGTANYLARALADGGTPRKLVALSAGVSGQTIETLSPGNPSGLYNRVPTGLQAFVNAVPGGATRGCSAILWMQGEFNYFAENGGTTTKTGYKTALTSLRNQMNTDVVAKTGQATLPAFFIYQTGASYTQDNNQLAIGMAQWEFVRENAGCYMVGPVYPVTDKGGHLDANGYRWFGQQVGKVMHRVLALGQGWEPLSPLWVEMVGKTVYVGFSVPEPPLQFQLPYVGAAGTVGNAAADYTNRGFRITDAAGDVSISAVRFVGATIVAIDCARRPDPATALVWYASNTASQGNGCLCDSDKTIANDDYSYQAGIGHYTTANIPALVGRPYPLWNWAIAFCLPVIWSR